MGLIYLYTGEGGGKTTAALGAALRALGHGQKVVIIQFMKGRKNIGEWKIQKRLKPNLEVHQFGRAGWINLKNPSEKDKEIALKGLRLAESILKNTKPNVLILDEINLAVACNILDVDNVLSALKKIPAKTTVFLTGRHAPKKLVKRADFVAEMKQIKHPYYKGIKAVKGIQW